MANPHKIIPVFLILILYANLRLHAHTEPLRFVHIDGEQGLSHNTVSAVLQDRHGFMWFGTVDGLNRFDGYQCQVFKNEPQNPQSLPSSFIHCLLEDTRGILWIGFRNGGLAALTPEGRKENAFLRFMADPTDPHSLSHDTVQTLFQDSRKRLWVGTRKGLDLMDWERQRFVNYRFFGPGTEDLVVTSLAEDEEGVLWVGTSDGLYAVDLSNFHEIDPSQGSQRAVSWRHDPGNPKSLPGNMINNLFIDKKGRIWVACRGRGLSLLRDDGFQTFTHQPNNPQSFSGNNLKVNFQDKQGRLWVGTDGRGLNIFDPETGIFERHRHQPSRADSLSNDNVTQTYQSRDGENGVIWVITWGGGVNKLIDEYQPFSLVRHDPENPNSLSSNFVYSLQEDQFGDLWVGSIGRGLNRWRRDTSTWDHYSHNPKDINSIGDNHIWDIVADGKGDLWIATEFGGLNQVIRKSRSDPVIFLRHQMDPNKPNGLVSNNIKAFLEDRAGNYWVGYAEAGLGRQTPQQRHDHSWTHMVNDPDNPNSLSDNRIQCLFQDDQGRLWMGTASGGLNLWRPESYDGSEFITSYQHDPNDPRSLGSNDVRDMIQISDGRLAAGLFGGGLNILLPDGSGFQRYTEADGLSNNIVYAMAEDAQGNLWLSTNRGLSRCSLMDMTFLNFGVRHGLQSDEFNTGAVAIGSNGTMYFGGVNGLNYFHPKILWEKWNRRQAWRPPVVLTGFAKMGRPQSLHEFLSSEGVMNLVHGDKFFSFEMAVLDYHHPDRNRFSYQLKGFDDQWVDHHSRNFVSYTNLDPGHYVFHYRGANNAGVWNEGTPLPIYIAPPFWASWWFRTLMALTILGSIAAGFQIKKYYQAYRGVRFVGPYKILSTLGTGGCGTVYLARDKLARREVALKVLNQSMENTKDGVRRFLQEAEIGRRLNHPNIVDIFEAGNYGDTRFISMEHLKGRTLKDYLKEKGRLTEAEIFPIALQIMEGLEAIHGEEIVHRDLKSGNVMVLENGVVKIMDFGLARISALTTVENRDQLMGTLAFMSPEQTMGKVVDGRTDIYAVGVMLYEMWFGEMPFSAQNEMEMIYAIHNETPPGLNGDSKDASPLTIFIANCMEKRPQDRPPTAQAMKSDFLSEMTTPRASLNQSLENSNFS